MDKKYDAILVLDNQINEDVRINKKIQPSGVDHGPGNYIDIDDPRLYATNNVGRYLQSAFTSLGQGYWGEVSDFGKWFVVTIGHHNHITGRTSTKTFLIVFNHDKKYTSVVMSSTTKWRTITDPGQAVSYIKSCAALLANETNRKL